MNLKLTIPFALSLLACDGVNPIDGQTRDIDISLDANNAVSKSFARCAQEEEGLQISQIMLDDASSIQRILNFDDSSFMVQRSGREVAWMSLSSMEMHEQFFPNEHAQAVQVTADRRNSIVEYIGGEEHALSVTPMNGQGFSSLIEMPEPLWDVQDLVVSPRGQWIIPTQWFAFDKTIYMANTRRGKVIQVETGLDGANQALFYDNETVVVGGSINWGGIGVELKDLSNPHETVASWTYEDRRCGSAGQIHTLHQSPSGKSILVGGELYGNGFLALLDAETLEEKSIVHDLDWSVQNALFVDENTIASIGTSVRLWDAATMEQKTSVELNDWSKDAVMIDQDLWLVDSQGSLVRLECAD